MKVTALLAWYDEQPKMLAELVASVSRFCEHIVAADGAYRLYPTRHCRSKSEQAETILRVAHGAGIGCTLIVPDEPWQNNEVEKRNVLFDAGRLTNADWFFIIDGDEVVADVAANVRGSLAATDLDVGIVRFIQADQWASPLIQRRFFRNVEGLRVEGAHYVFVAPGNADRESGWTPRYLRGRDDIHDLEPAEEFDLTIQHRDLQRLTDRALAMETYNTIRDASGAERLFNYEVGQ